MRVRASQAIQSDSSTSFAVDCADVRSIHDRGRSGPASELTPALRGAEQVFELGQEISHFALLNPA